MKAAEDSEGVDLVFGKRSKGTLAYQSAD